MTKLIIWDLDDTLWDGTLAEGDEVTLNAFRATTIKQLNARGIVNSICSKNNHDQAERTLKGLRMWDEFVFPEIAFAAKGISVKRILSDMRLRAADTVFIDDNALNLREVEFVNPGVITLDASSPDADAYLRQLLKETEGASKNRVAQYRILEKKRTDREANVHGDNDEFLRTCEIKMTVLERADNLPHAERIEELINRTNQLNFTKLRVETGSMADVIINTTENFTYSAFVWDKYGSYGLVGFASVFRRRRLDHFLFSCRTMNMGIESALASIVSQRCLVEDYPVDAEIPNWIEIVPQESPEFIEQLDHALVENQGEPDVRIMANCQSAALAHYMPRNLKIDFDNYPRLFLLPAFARRDLFTGGTAPVMVYGAFVDYDAYYWGGLPTNDEYRKAAFKLAEFMVSDGRKMLVLLPPEEFTQESPESGQTRERYRQLNQVWRQLAVESPEHLSVIEISECLDDDAPVTDPRHFPRNLLIELAGRISVRVDQVYPKIVS